MKIKVTVLLVCIQYMLFAQEEREKDTLPKKCISFNDFSILPTMEMSKLPFSSVADFQKLAPNSVLLTKDLSNYSNGVGFGKGHAGGRMQKGMAPSLTLMAGFKLKGMEHASLRIGIGYQSGVNFSNDYYLETTSIYDTLTSTKTGQKIYAQQQNKDRYSMKNSYEQLHIDISYLIKAKLGRRFSFYTGIGATAGVTFNNVTDIQHVNQIIYDGYKDNTTTIGNESFQNKNAAAYSAYIPLGLNFRLGHRNSFLKRISIFAESRPSVSFINVPEVKRYTSVSLQNGLGLRFKF